MTRLFDALRRVDGGEQGQGAIFVDGSKVYRQWIEDGSVWLESTGMKDVAFADQDLSFDDSGSADVIDKDGQARKIRILVMVPFNRYLFITELIDPPPAGGAV